MVETILCPFEFVSRIEPSVQPEFENTAELIYRHLVNDLFNRAGLLMIIYD